MIAISVARFCSPSNQSKNYKTTHEKQNTNKKNENKQRKNLVLSAIRM